ncbi:MAG: CotH kinase family protein, partial [Ignavibacteriaceae bacterium]
SGDLLTGGYIIKIDKMEGSNIQGWYSNFPPYPGAWQQIYYQYHYPDPDEIVPEQESYIQNFIYQFEYIMDQGTYTDPFSGYYDFININSFADHFILNEIAKNVDAYRLSAFMYKDRDSEDGRLTMGPIWDFNLAFGNADYYNGWLFIGWQLNTTIIQDYWQVPFWWSKFLNDSVFMNRISRRWFEYRQTSLSQDTLSQYIDWITTELDEASVRNFTRWPILGIYIWPNAFIGNSYQEEIEYLRTWLNNRIYWIDNTLNPQYSVVSGRMCKYGLNYIICSSWNNPLQTVK